MSSRPHTRRLGFSLLELSVSLGIISLLVVAGVSMGAGALKAADRVSTQERLATIKQALETYAKINGFLPCPANRAETPSGHAADFGFEKRVVFPTSACMTSSGLVLVGTAPNGAYIGAVPVRSLGLPDNYAGDAWGNKLTYAVSQPHISATDNYAANEGTLEVRYGDRSGGTNYALTTGYVAGTASTVASQASVTSGTGGVFRFTTTANHGLFNGSLIRITGVSTVNGFYLATVVSPTAFELQNTPYVVPANFTNATVTPFTIGAGPGATYVVVSHGADGVGAFPMLGTSVSTACPDNNVTTNGNQTENCDDIRGAPNVPNLIFYDTEFNNSNSQTSLLFDDYVVWGSNAAARSLLKPPVYDATCPPGTCATWCARCTTNFPSSTGSNTPDTAVPPAMTNAVLCKKIMTNTTTTTCQAACIWSGTSTSASNPGYVECP